MQNNTTQHFMSGNEEEECLQSEVQRRFQGQEVCLSELESVQDIVVHILALVKGVMGHKRGKTSVLASKI